MRIDRKGGDGPTPKQARGPGWRRSSRGLYVPSIVEATTDQRIVEAAAVLPAGGAVTGWAALRWLGGCWFDGISEGCRRPVVLVTGTHNLRWQSGLVISQEGLGPGETEVLDGVPVTSALRSVLFEMRYSRSLAGAVRAADMALFDDLVSIDEMAAYVATQTSITGIQRGRDALALCDENSWSPQETNLRLTWRLTAQLPPPLTNQPVFDLEGRHLATPDLFSPDLGLAVEYDGVLHLEGRRRRRDRDRLERLSDHGIETLVVMAGDDAGDVANRLIQVSRRRTAYGPPTPQRWTLALPSWWEPTVTVTQRRALAPGPRAVWLSHRRRVS